MYKNTRKKLAKVLAFTLASALVMPSVFSTEAQAAPALKLSKKKVTISVGEAAKIKVKKIKAKKIKKLTVKVNKKAIATVKKSGKTAFKIAGKKAGKAVVTVKVKTAKKTMTQKVKVTVKKVEKKGIETPLPTATSSGGATLTPTVTPSATPLINYTETFDTNTGLWSAKSGSTIAISNEAHTGAGALLVSRNQAGNQGICMDMTNRIASPMYTLIFWAKSLDTNASAAETMELKITGTYKKEAHLQEVTECYPADTTYTIQKGEWTRVEVEFALPLHVIYYTLNIEAVGNNASSYLIDDLCLSLPSRGEPERQPSIRDTYAQVGLENFGVVVTDDQLLNDNVMNFTKAQYSSVTLPKQMSPDAMIERENTILADSVAAADYIVNDTYGTREGNQDAEGNAILPCIDFTYVDKAMRLAQENGLKLRYSTLLDEAKIPAHFYTEGYSTAEDAVVVTDADTLSERKEMYVRTVMNHILNSPYVDTLYAVDVVRDYMHGENAVTDSEEVKNAFVWAYDELVKAGKTEQISLFYSDYNTYEPGVAEQIIQLINHVNSAGKICAGVAMQSHFDDEHATVENFETALQAFAEQNYEIQITELRVTNIGTVDADTDHEEKMRVWNASAEVYSDIMTAILRQRREGANISSVTLDSLTDATSEKEDRAPVLFGAYLDEEKPAFDAVIDAASNEQ
nr:endo-1,4-beta-xylanase [Eubacterium sp.]